MPMNMHHYKQRPKFIPKSRWSGSGNYYRHSTTHKWTKWSRKRDLARGSHKSVGSPRRLAHTTDKKLRRRRR